MRNDSNQRFTAIWVVGRLEEVHPGALSESDLLNELEAEWPRFSPRSNENVRPSDLLQPVLLDLEEKRKIQRVDRDQWRSYRAWNGAKDAATQAVVGMDTRPSKADTWIKARTFKPVVVQDDHEAHAIFREIAIRYRPMSPLERMRIGELVERDPVLARKVKEDRGFICQVCGPDTSTTFGTETGENYVEAHHMDRLADGGADIEANLLVLCATCHKKFHFLKGERKAEPLNDTLRVTLGDNNVTIHRYRGKDWERQEGHGE